MDNTIEHPKPYKHKNSEYQKEILNYLKHELGTVNWNIKKHGENYERKAHKEILEYHIAMEDLTLGINLT